MQADRPCFFALTAKAISITCLLLDGQLMEQVTAPYCFLQAGGQSVPHRERSGGMPLALSP